MEVLNLSFISGQAARRPRWTSESHTLSLLLSHCDRKDEHTPAVPAPAMGQKGKVLPGTGDIRVGTLRIE